MTPIPTQKRNLPLLATPTTCSGRTYIVTGSNTGLGFEAAQHLALAGAARVILAVRNPAAGEVAKAAIDAALSSSSTTHQEVKVEVWPLDLGSYDSVKAFAARAERELERIDGVVENAAVAGAGGRAEGHRTGLTVNVLGTLLLAALLLPVMKGKRVEGEVQRVVVVTSRVGFDARADWEGVVREGDFVEGMDREEVEEMKM